jgi:hypothetical protein
MVPGKAIAAAVSKAQLTWYSDAFAGGFCAGTIQGKSLEECVKMGQWLAKLSIQEVGPSYVNKCPILLAFSIRLVIHGKSEMSLCERLIKPLAPGFLPSHYH